MSFLVVVAGVAPVLPKEVRSHPGVGEGCSASVLWPLWRGRGVLGHPVAPSSSSAPAWVATLTEALVKERDVAHSDVAWLESELAVE